MARDHKSDLGSAKLIRCSSASGLARLRNRFLLAILAVAVCIATALPASGVASAHTGAPAAPLQTSKAGATRCRPVRGTGKARHTRVTVFIGRGQIGCGTARLVAKKLFSNQAKFHASCGAAYCFYYTVQVHGKLWKGGLQTGGWRMRPATCPELKGCDTIVGGEYQDLRRVAAARLLRAGSFRYCGTIHGTEGWHARLGAEHISCRKARRILTYWFNGGPGVRSHLPPGKAEFTTLRAYPGWRCVIGGGGCFKGQKSAGYSRPMG